TARTPSLCSLCALHLGVVTWAESIGRHIQKFVAISSYPSRFWRGNAKPHEALAWRTARPAHRHCRRPFSDRLGRYQSALRGGPGDCVHAVALARRLAVREAALPAARRPPRAAPKLGAILRPCPTRVRRHKLS